MLLLALSALAASADPAPTRAPPSAATAGATGTATVTLLEARTVPMSADSLRRAPQRPTMIRLADGEHQALIVEFE